MLPPKWEYLQPHLNSLGPDFVLINKNIGIAIFEVKDWNIDLMNYYVKNNELPIIYRMPPDLLDIVSNFANMFM